MTSEQRQESVVNNKINEIEKILNASKPIYEYRSRKKVMRVKMVKDNNV